VHRVKTASITCGVILNKEVKRSWWPCFTELGHKTCQHVWW